MNISLKSGQHLPTQKGVNFSNDIKEKEKVVLQKIEKEVSIMDTDPVHKTYVGDWKFLLQWYWNTAGDPAHAQEAQSSILDDAFLGDLMGIDSEIAVSPSTAVEPLDKSFGSYKSVQWSTTQEYEVDGV